MKNFTPFNGKFDGYAVYRGRIRNHVGSRWRAVMDFVEKTEVRITMGMLQNAQNVGPFPDARLAQELYDYLGTTFADDIFRHMKISAGGEEGNGFELWRGYYFELMGGDELMKVHGDRQFHNFPRCTDHSKLKRALEKWNLLKLEHGAGMPERNLRTMLLGVLPEDLENDVMNRPELQTVHDIINDSLI